MMMRQLSATLVTCLLTGFAPLGALAAQADYAGSWSVLVVTTSGNCDKAFRYSVNIARNGVITYGGPSQFTASGRVAANGAVRVRIARGSDYAQGSGRLRGARGSGSWESPSGGCRGRWQADRRSS